jgi:cysteinyl-tRNA synthetase
MRTLDSTLQLKLGRNWNTFFLRGLVTAKEHGPAPTASMDEATELTLDTLTGMGYTGREIRYWLLSGHYRKPITFSPDRLDHARRSLKRLDACIHSLMNASGTGPFPELDQLVYDLKQGFAGAMDVDLNISAALASTFQVVKRINQLTAENRLDAADARKLLDAFQKIDAVLNIFDFGEAVTDERIQSLLEERREARRKKDWALSDRIRKQLQDMGVQVRDDKI